MSQITLVEQTNPGAQSAGQQKVYVKSAAATPPFGSLARVDSTGIERTTLDSGTYAAAATAIEMQVNFWGI